MNRYTETVYRPVTRIKWRLLAADAAMAILTPLATAAHKICNAAQSFVRKLHAAAIATAVGAAIAVETYRLMA